jgi:glycosyltransferase involved in cell wall biosynthesis
MRIGIDVRTLMTGGTGDRTYFRQVISAMARLSPDDHWTLYADSADPDRESLRAPNVTLAPPVRAPVGALWNVTTLLPLLRQDKADILHAQYTLPLLGRPPCPMVVTIHDATFRQFPQWFPRHAHRVMNLIIPIAARRADRILTVSESAAADIARTMQVPREKIVVTPNGVSDRFHPIEPATQDVIRARYGLPPVYILGVGILRARKNAAVALNAMAKLQSEGKWPADAVFALSGKWEEAPEDALRHRENPAVRFLGRISDEDLPAVFAAATASVYPSFYEGFGLPPLESMASGCPAVAADTSSLPEVLGDAGLLLPPTDVDAWAKTMLSLLTDADLRDELRTKGLARAAQFTWERCARQTLAVYREVVGHQ